jgi:hypothetical protein
MLTSVTTIATQTVKTIPAVTCVEIHIRVSTDLLSCRI